MLSDCFGSASAKSPPGQSNVVLRIDVQEHAP